MNRTSSSIPARPFVAIARAIAAGALFVALPHTASADIVTGTVAPANAKVVITNAAGEQVAELKPGAYQIQLPLGKYKAQCQAPTEKTQDVLVLSEPVTLNIDCS